MSGAGEKEAEEEIASSSSSPPPPTFKTPAFLPPGPVKKTEDQPKNKEPFHPPSNLPNSKPPAPPGAGTPALPYSEPSWSGLPPASASSPGYSLEVLKNGVLVQNFNLKGKSFFVVGRLKTCDIPMEHPSLSRYHAVIQYRAEKSEEEPVGFYLYDLGSTHGSWHNKKQCYPKKYYRLRVGHMIKFGGSTRMLLLQGPDEDTEEESNLSVTELQKIAQKKAEEKSKAREEERERLEKERERRLKEEEEDVSRQGISWGMADDATEEEDEDNPDLSKNPYAQTGAASTLSLDDPKKTLRGWFEREGLELEYNCVEKGYASFHCTVELPLDESEGGPITAEASVKGGKKKEAVVQCALEACRILDSRGLLKNSNQESRAKKQLKKWEDDDFYASDEDEFLDRTGGIDVKRQKRMKLAGKTESKESVETYESLLAKNEVVQNEMIEAGSELKSLQDLAKQEKRDKEEQDQGADDEDLDAYMNKLKQSSGSVDKGKIMKLKQKVSELQKEALRIEKLIKIAKPTSMPALKMPNSSGSLSKTKTLAPKSGVMIGKRFGFGAKNKIRTLDPNAPKTVIKVAKLAAFDDANEREERKTRLPINLEDEPEQASIPDEEDTKPPPPKKMMGLCLPESLKPVETNPPVAPSSRDKFASPDPIPKLSEDNDTKVPVDRFNPLPEASDDGNVGDDGEDVPETEPEPKKRKNRGRKRRGPASDIDHTNDGDIDDSSTVVPGDYDDSLADEKYATWMPPQGQSGDGRTNLNDKLGY